MEIKKCKMCDKVLPEGKRLWCDNRCKQEAKYLQSKGLKCKFCHKAMPPKPVMGGMKQDCVRKSCIENRKPKRK